jgi:hypothetical protein
MNSTSSVASVVTCRMQYEFLLEGDFQWTKQRCGQILRFAVATGRAIRDVTVDLLSAPSSEVGRAPCRNTAPSSSTDGSTTVLVPT